MKLKLIFAAIVSIFMLATVAPSFAATLDLGRNRTEQVKQDQKDRKKKGKKKKEKTEKSEEKKEKSDNASEQGEAQRKAKGK